MLEHVSTYLSKSTKKNMFFFFWGGVFPPPDHEDFRVKQFGKCKTQVCHGSSIRQNLPRLRTLPVQVHSSASQGIDDFRWPGHQEVFPWVENWLTCWRYPTKLMAFLGGGVGDSQKHVLYKHLVYNYTLPETNIAQVITFFWWAGFSRWIMD